MNRRDFLFSTSAGLTAILISDNIWAITADKLFHKKKFAFRPFQSSKSLVDCYCVTPDDGFYMHSFYDVCPWSPNARYLLVTKLPYQQKKPRWGDQAEVCLIDLQEQTIETIYHTKAWSYQVGTHAQWDSINSHLVYTNDIIDGKPVCVRINLTTGEVKAFSGSLYSVSPDGQYIISPNLMTMNTHQYGYSVPDISSAEFPHGKALQFSPEDMKKEGLWRTNLTTNNTELLVSFAEFANNVADKKKHKGGLFYLFHSKYNQQNSKIMQVVRYINNVKGRGASLFTMDADGNNLTQCLTNEKWNHKGDHGGGGNHPNWHPNGQDIIMNCIPKWLGDNEMRVCQFKYDGGNFKTLVSQQISSGHPTIHPNERYVVTDAYSKQTYTLAKGTDPEIPIRFFDLKTGQEQTLLTVSNNVGGMGKPYTKLDKKLGGSPHKLDPHPAWNRNYTQLCFNGADQMKRKVYIADLKDLIE
ncbi:MAG: hypothetical protein ACI9IJ_000013 [Psychromonas sp.]|jgi:hypothetical protein